MSHKYSLLVLKEEDKNIYLSEFFKQNTDIIVIYYDEKKAIAIPELSSKFTRPRVLLFGNDFKFSFITGLLDAGMKVDIFLEGNQKKYEISDLKKYQDDITQIHSKVPLCYYLLRDDVLDWDILTKNNISVQFELKIVVKVISTYFLNYFSNILEKDSLFFFLSFEKDNILTYGDGNLFKDYLTTPKEIYGIGDLKTVGQYIKEGKKYYELITELTKQRHQSILRREEDGIKFAMIQCDNFYKVTAYNIKKNDQSLKYAVFYHNLPKDHSRYEYHVFFIGEREEQHDILAFTKKLLGNFFNESTSSENYCFATTK